MKKLCVCVCTRVLVCACVCFSGVVVNSGTIQDRAIVCRVVSIVDPLFWGCFALWTQICVILVISHRALSY